MFKKNCLNNVDVVKNTTQSLYFMYQQLQTLILTIKIIITHKTIHCDICYT